MSTINDRKIGKKHYQLIGRNELKFFTFRMSFFEEQNNLLKY